MRWIVPASFVAVTIMVLVSRWQVLWFNKYPWFATVLLTGVLVIVTALYTSSSFELARSAREQLALEKEVNLIPVNAALRVVRDPSVIEVGVELSNLSRAAVRVGQVTILDNEGTNLVNARTSEVIGPNDTGEIVIPARLLRSGQEFEDADHEAGRTDQWTLANAILRRAARIEFYFQFGATGRQYHRIVLNKLLDSTEPSEAKSEHDNLQKLKKLFDTSDFVMTENVTPPTVDRLLQE